MIFWRPHLIWLLNRFKPASQWHVFGRAKAANLDWQQIELMSDQELSARVRAAKEYECQLLAGSSSEPKYPNIFAHRIATAV